jgi:hypothetical protein
MSVADNGRPTGVSYSGVDFPFVLPSADVKGLFADFHLVHRVKEVVVPLRVKWLYGFRQPTSAASSESGSSSDGLPDSIHASDLLVVDAADRVIFDSTKASEYKSHDWDSRFRIHEWISDTAVCKVVQHTSGPDGYGEYPNQWTPESAVLDERCSELLPDQVLAFKVNDQLITGAIEIQGGYNVEAVLTEVAFKPGKAYRNLVTVTADPGLGDGLFPSCQEPDLSIRRVNQQRPDEYHNLLLSAKDCYWLERPANVSGGLATPTLLNGLKVNNDCRPCCECDDFVNTYMGIRKLYDKYKVLGVRSNVVRNQYVENRDRWLADKECRADHPARVSFLPYYPKGGYISAGYCNSTGQCVGKLKLEIEFQTNLNFTGKVKKSTVLWYPTSGGHPEFYTLGGDWPIYYAIWEPVDTARMARVKFQMTWKDAPVGARVKVIVRPYINDSPTPQPEATITRHLIIEEPD